MRLIFFFCLIAPIYLQAQSVDLKSIDGKIITIAPKDTQFYHLNLTKNQFAFMQFDQQGADIVIHIKNPEGLLLMEFDGGNGNNGQKVKLPNGSTRK